jgi:hypothetical protein
MGDRLQRGKLISLMGQGEWQAHAKAGFLLWRWRHISDIATMQPCNAPHKRKPKPRARRIASGAMKRFEDFFTLCCRNALPLIADIDLG